jgi:1-acyl-sn-glycerol-3-phosphate acyltransferase
LSRHPLLAVRAFLFNAFFFAWTVLLCILGLPVLPFLSERGVRAYARFWERGIHAVLRLLVGLTYEVRGAEHLPTTPAIVASKHQSAWETLTFHLLIHDVAVGLKHELTRIPLLGWYFLKGGAIRIDRGGAARAMRSLVDGARRAAARGCSILIFPEGTRHAPEDPPDYKPGVAALYAALDLPVVPVALNSGLFWGRRAFLKRPGRIVVEFLEPIPPGLDRRGLMAELERRTETATARLVAEGRERYGTL